MEFWYAYINDAVRQFGVDGATTYFIVIGFVLFDAAAYFLALAIFAVWASIKSTAQLFI